MARRPLDAETVFDAAARVADAGGFWSFTLRGVAAEAGVRPPSLYNHVPGGLDEVRAGLRARAVRQLADALEAAVLPDTPAGAPHSTDATTDATAGAAMLRRCIAAMRELARTHPGMYEAALPGHPPEAAAEAGEIAPELAEAGWRVTTLLRRVSETLGHRDSEATHHARVLRGAIDGCIEAERRGAWAESPEADETFEALVTTLTHGRAGP